MITRQVFYEGRVQGIGFRYTVKSMTKGFDVSGWVRNLEDGRVELQVAGASDEVTAFLRAIRESELASHISAAHEHEAAALTDVKGFEIRA